MISLKHVVKSEYYMENASSPVPQLLGSFLNQVCRAQGVSFGGDEHDRALYSAQIHDRVVAAELKRETSHGLVFPATLHGQISFNKCQNMFTKRHNLYFDL